MMSLLLASQNSSEASNDMPELVLRSTILLLGDRTNDGQIVTAVQLPWLEIVKKINNDPGFLAYFSKHSRAFEEFLAGIYKTAGFEVTLTPHSNDGGRDVIATVSGFCCVKILGQAKAYRPGHLVTHNDVNAMLGVLSRDHDASKAMIVTTSDFQPGVYKDPKIQQFVPSRLELINGSALPEWIKCVQQPQSKVPSIAAAE
jgi:restriction system protein